MQIGYVGLGSMGGALAKRLQLAYPLLVFDTSEGAIQTMCAAGAARAGSLADLATRCDVIFLCLPTSRQVRQVIFGDQGLLRGLRPGALLIDQTTGDPADTREMASTLEASGIRLIDAPVSGGKAGAAAGTIAVMVGADDETFSIAKPILQAISSNIFHAGGIGNGHVIKLVNNMMSTVQRALSFEAVSLAAKCGVPPDIATEILLKSGGRNAYLERMMAPRILQGKLNVGFTLALAHKDLRLACQMASDAGVPALIGNLTRDIYQLCISEMGGEAQVDTIGLFYDRVAQTAVVPQDNDLQWAGARNGASAPGDR